MANDPNTIQYVIQEDGFWYVASKDRTPGVPEITVSAKGVANGLSTEYNDGYDFGPDSYNPTSTSAIPYTQTLGILEAVNYVFNNGGGKIFIKRGLYDITNAPVGGIGTSAQISIPASELTTGNSVYIEIVGEGAGNNFEEDNPVSLQTGSTIIRSLNTSNGGNILGANETSSGTMSNVYVKLDGIQFQTTQENINFGGVNLYYAMNVEIGTIKINTYYDTGNAPSTVNAGNGLTMPFIQTNSSRQYIGDVQISGFTYGLAIGGHTYIGKYESIYNLNALYVSGTTYPSYISFFDIQQFNNAIYIDGSTVMLGFGMISFGDEGTSGTFAYNSFIYNTSTSNYAYLSGTVGISNNAGLTMNIVNPDTVYAHFKFVSINNSSAPYISFPFTPTLTANPPVSGTVYQNTNPYDIEIDLPAYASTSGTAGYVTVAKGATDTPSSIGNQYVSGDTSDTSEQIIRLRVPAGWYYEFTASGVTFGTASVFAD